MTYLFAPSSMFTRSILKVSTSRGLRRRTITGDAMATNETSTKRTKNPTDFRICMLIGVKGRVVVNVLHGRAIVL